MGSLVVQLARQQCLLDAWSSIREAADPGSNTAQAIRAFEPRAASRIAEIGAALAAGTWRPRPVFPVTIPKPDGSARELGVPALEDRIVERAVLSVLDPLVDPHLLPWSFAYRRGLGVPDAIDALVDARDRGTTHVVRGDFADCFASFPRARVVNALAALVGDAEMVELVRLLVYRPVVGDKDSGPVGLHEGSPLSPLLANVYLHHFDTAMLSKGWQVVRYADDFAIPASSQGEAEQAIVDASRTAAGLGLDLSGSKTSVHTFDEGVPFLGTIVSAASTQRRQTTKRSLQSTVYVVNEGGLLRSKGERLRLERDGETVLSVAWNRVRQLVIFGRTGFTTPFVQQALARGIDLVLLDPSGRFQGRLQAGSSTNATVRLAQYRACDDDDRRLVIARQLVAGKIANQRVLLVRSARRGDFAWIGQEVRALDESRRAVDAARNLNELRGVEGAASRRYFRALARLLGDGWGFEARKRRPPPDPVNALLSLGYTLLLHDAIAAAEAAHLDPYVGMLHDVQVGRPSLALDLIEEFRPLIVDSVVVRALKTGMLRADSFEYQDAGDDKTNCRCTGPGLKRFIAAYERRMLTVFSHAVSGRRVSYRVGVQLQARLLADALSKTDGVYQPILWK
ncbi:CRISPR-associated endonuclease Cas1 [Rhabdothermincola sp.]|uniref:CRISPR-associated endonuclease Cas1 n=1 Tax=Rhabdothermincola sp. TaxID=2820405 RepID=UPI002FE1C5B8